MRRTVSTGMIGYIAKSLRHGRGQVGGDFHVVGQDGGTAGFRCLAREERNERWECILIGALAVLRAAQYGAYCLDGSTPGYWYQPPMPLPRTSQWLIFLDGGAWCYDAHSCESRAKGFKGTGEKSIPQSNFYKYGQRRMLRGQHPRPDTDWPDGTPGERG